MHGRDHRPGGTDPIPGLGGSGLPWALLAGDGGPYTIDHTGGTNLIDLTPGPAADFYTMSPSVFDTGTHSSKGCLEILEAGFYRLIINGEWASLEAAAVGEVNFFLWSVPGGASPSDNPNWLFGRQAAKGDDVWAGIPGGATSGLQVFHEYVVNILDADVPVQVVVWALQYNATVNKNLTYVQAYMEQISPTPYTGTARFPGNSAPYT